MSESVGPESVMMRASSRRLIPCGDRLDESLLSSSLGCSLDEYLDPYVESFDERDGARVGGFPDVVASDHMEQYIAELLKSELGGQAESPWKLLFQYDDSYLDRFVQSGQFVSFWIRDDHLARLDFSHVWGWSQ